LWTLWELVLLGEPVVVKSAFPQSCSRAVLALVDLITPLDYGGDFRPYSTIHDPDLSSVFNIEGFSAKILGVTNPVFERMLEDWPHHIMLGQWQDRSPISSTPIVSSRPSTKHVFSAASPMLITQHRRTVARDKRLLNTLKHGQHASNSKLQRCLTANMAQYSAYLCPISRRA
jgi:hypothetical protein